MFVCAIEISLKDQDLNNFALNQDVQQTYPMTKMKCFLHGFIMTIYMYGCRTYGCGYVKSKFRYIGPLFKIC